MSRQNDIQGDYKYRENDMQETPVVLTDYKYIDRSLLTDYLSSIDPGIITRVRNGRGDKQRWSGRRFYIAVRGISQDIQSSGNTGAF
jgi:hypothetical protein